MSSTGSSLSPSDSGAQLDALRAAFPRVPGYLNAASLGVPPHAVSEAMTGALTQWAAGQAGAADYDIVVAESRRLFAQLVGVDASGVAVGSQVSVFAGLVAASLPDDVEVVCVDGDFSSMVFPFAVHADRGVSVRHVPLDALADSVGERTALVAFSLVQSADGAMADGQAVAAAARRHGAVTFCDLTQAAGAMPVDASMFDVTVTSAYKWLCAPRGSAFLTVTPQTALRLRPINAGWYAGQDVWASCYGPDMALAQDARRFDVSPAWLSWVGTVPALRLFAGADMRVVREHGAGLADSLRARLSMPGCGRPVVAIPDADGARLAALQAAGLRVAGRAGLVRIAFHVWNDADDVERAARALGS